MMKMEAVDDATLLAALFQARQRVSNYELHARAARIRDVAVELIHTAHTQLADALARIDIEQIEAGESLMVFRLARQNATDRMADVIAELNSALGQAGAKHPLRQPLQDFLHDHHADTLSIQTTARLVQAVGQARHFVSMLPYPDARDTALEECAQLLTAAQEDFEREESDVVVASNELMSARDQAYISLLNARDILRAALRDAGAIDQLDHVLPPPSQLLASL